MAYQWRARKSDGRILVWATHVEKIQKCPRQFWYDKLSEKKDETTNGFRIAGTILDGAVTANLECMRYTGKPLDRKSYEEALAFYWKDWTQNRIPVDWSDGPTPEEFAKAIRDAAWLHYDFIAPTIKMRTEDHAGLTQARCELQVDEDVWLCGYLDIVEADGFIRDLKFSKSKKKANMLPTVQPASYVAAAKYGRGIDVQGFQLDYIVWGEGDVYHDPRPITITPNDLRNCVNEARDIGRLFAASEGLEDPEYLFPRCAPTQWYCSEKWCDHFAACRGSNRMNG